MNVIVSTVGTSLLTSQCEDQAQRALVNRYTNEKTPDAIADPDHRAQLESILDKALTALTDAEPAQAARWSAELNGLLSFARPELPKSNDQFILLCTDTWLGEQTGQLVKLWLEGSPCGCRNVDLVRHPDLQTKSLDEFQLSLSNLVRWCEDRLRGLREGGWHVVFNLTGGFKSVQGFLQLLAIFYADEVVYIFESNRDLLRIPRLPVRMADYDEVCRHFEALRRLSLGIQVDVAGIPGTFLMRAGDEVGLSPWGRIVWEQHRREVYGERVYDSPTPQVRFGPRFRDTLGVFKVEQQPDRALQINSQIDQLVTFMRSGRRLNPGSLHFHAIGNAMPPSTHEIYAWSDRGAYRIFCTDHGSFVKLDKLAPHPKEKD